MARVVFTENQFKNYMRRILQEKRNDDFLKQVLAEELEKGGYTPKTDNEK